MSTNPSPSADHRSEAGQGGAPAGRCRHTLVEFGEHGVQQVDRNSSVPRRRWPARQRRQPEEGLRERFFGQQALCRDTVRRVTCVRGGDALRPHALPPYSPRTCPAPPSQSTCAGAGPFERSAAHHASPAASSAPPPRPGRRWARPAPTAGETATDLPAPPMNAATAARTSRGTRRRRGGRPCTLVRRDLDT